MRFETMVDGRGVELESEKPFLFACCDCGLVHRCAIASHDGKTVGFAVQRDQGETEKRRRDERDRLVRGEVDRGGGGGPNS